MRLKLGPITNRDGKHILKTFKQTYYEKANLLQFSRTFKSGITLTAIVGGATNYTAYSGEGMFVERVALIVYLNGRVRNPLDVLPQTMTLHSVARKLVDNEIIQDLPVETLAKMVRELEDVDAGLLTLEGRDLVI